MSSSIARVARAGLATQDVPESPVNYLDPGIVMKLPFRSAKNAQPETPSAPKSPPAGGVISLRSHNVALLAAANFDAMREWNHALIYRKTIVLFSQRLQGR